MDTLQHDHRLYAHLLWTTVAGLPLIGRGRRAVIESHLIQLSRSVDIEPVEVCVLPGRAHLLLRFCPGQCLADVSRRLQRRSEEIANVTGLTLRWSRRYGIVTVSPDAVREVRRRIAFRAWPTEEGRSPVARATGPG